MPFDNIPNYYKARNEFWHLWVPCFDICGKNWNFDICGRRVMTFVVNQILTFVVDVLWHLWLFWHLWLRCYDICGHFDICGWRVLTFVGILTFVVDVLWHLWAFWHLWEILTFEGSTPPPKKKYLNFSWFCTNIIFWHLIWSDWPKNVSAVTIVMQKSL